MLLPRRACASKRGMRGEADWPFGDLFDLIDDQAGFGEQSQLDFPVTSDRYFFCKLKISPAIVTPVQTHAL